MSVFEKIGRISQRDKVRRNGGLTDAELKKLWRDYSGFKTALLNAGVPIESISESVLKDAVGLPKDAVWMEANFAE